MGEAAPQSLHLQEGDNAGEYLSRVSSFLVENGRFPVDTRCRVMGEPPLPHQYWMD